METQSPPVATLQPEEGESPTPQPDGSESPTPQPEEGGEPTPQPEEEGESPTPQPEEGGEPTPQPEEEEDLPTPQPEEGESPTPQPEEGGEPTPQPEEEEGGEPTPQPEGEEDLPTPQPEEEGEEGTPQPEGEEGPSPEEDEDWKLIEPCGETISEWGNCNAAPHCCSSGLKCFWRPGRRAKCMRGCRSRTCREVKVSNALVSRELGGKAPVCGNCESWQNGTAYCTNGVKGVKKVCNAIPSSGGCPTGETKCFRTAESASRARKLVQLVLKKGVHSFVKIEFRNMLQRLLEHEVEVSFKFICPSSACPEGSCGDPFGDSSKCLNLDVTDLRRAAVLESDGEEGSVVVFEIENSSGNELASLFNKKQLPGVVTMHEEWLEAAGDETAMSGTENSGESESKDVGKTNNNIVPLLIVAASVVAGCVLVAVATVLYRRSRAGNDFTADIDMTSLTTVNYPKTNRRTAIVLRV